MFNIIQVNGLNVFAYYALSLSMCVFYKYSIGEHEYQCSHI